MNRHRIRSAMLAAIASLAVIAGVLSAPATAANAANAADFDAGAIISDADFYQSSAMSVTAIQAFLEQRVPNCATGASCLKNHRQWTVAKTADRNCAGFGVNYMSAAEIIEGVSRSCGVSAKALLVLIEKEQALVGSRSPSQRMYTYATGFACPDTAPCSTQFEGFFNQVYHAARQFKIYRNTPSSWRYQAGRVNYIQWNPNAGCGGSNVYIQNQATAGLYIYTPYQPNRAALDNLYGTGDTCSAYGNRNFWRLWTDWFGPTNTFSIGGGIGEYYIRTGGASGSGLGNPTAEQLVVDRARSGWRQTFDNGSIYWSPGTGGWKVAGGIGIEYERLGGPAGSGLGYPVADQVQLNDSKAGWVQVFEYGRLYFSPGTGTVRTFGGIGAFYLDNGGHASRFGYPVAPYATLPGGGVQQFENGRLYWSPATDVVELAPAVASALDSIGGTDGSTLGFPVRANSLPAGVTAFQNGWLSTNGGVWRLQGGVGIAWIDGLRDRVGAPTGEQRPTDRGWMQPFVDGDIYWSGTTGSQPVTGDLRRAYDRFGGPAASGLGFPVASAVDANGALTQRFEFGSLSRTGSADVVRTFDDAARTQRFGTGGGLLGPLGAATSPRTPSANGGWAEEYANGRLLQSATATTPVRVSGGIAIGYAAAGGEGGPLGYPTGEGFPLGDSVGGWMQRFENGTLYWSGATGGVAVLGDLARGIEANGGPRQSLGIGYPSAAAENLSNGTIQRFSGGTAVLDGQQVRFVKGGVGAEWLRRGGLTSTLGRPVSWQTPDATGGWVQRFVNGSLYYSARTGVVSLSGGIGAVYVARGGPAGTGIGYPSREAVEIAGGWFQQFENGRLYWSPASGVVQVSGGVGASYTAGGAQASFMGLPLTEQLQLGDGGWTQTFQGGRILWAPGAGAHWIHGGVGWAYLQAGGSQGSGLGYPTSGQFEASGGRWVQTFQGGTITWTALTGARFS